MLGEADADDGRLEVGSLSPSSEKRSRAQLHGPELTTAGDDQDDGPPRLFQPLPYRGQGQPGDVFAVDRSQLVADRQPGLRRGR